MTEFKIGDIVQSNFRYGRQATYCGKLPNGQHIIHYDKNHIEDSFYAPVDDVCLVKSEHNESHQVGRPSKFGSDKELAQQIEDYFVFGVNNKKPTISGLCYYLGFESRQSFYDYEKNDEFSYTIKRARLRIETLYEENLQGPACTGSIFALKNFGWVDTQSLDHTSNGKEMKGFTLNVKPDTE